MRLRNLILLLLGLGMTANGKADCLGSGDPLIERLSLESMRDPARARALVDQALSQNRASSGDRAIWLRTIRTSALMEAGVASAPDAGDPGTSGAVAAPVRPAQLHLAIQRAASIRDTKQLWEALRALEHAMAALPDRSEAKICAAISIADLYDFSRHPEDGLRLLLGAYQQSRTMGLVRPRAEAAFVLGMVMRRQGDFDQVLAKSLSSLL